MAGVNRDNKLSRRKDTVVLFLPPKGGIIVTL